MMASMTPRKCCLRAMPYDMVTHEQPAGAGKGKGQPPGQDRQEYIVLTVDGDYLKPLPAQDRRQAQECLDIPESVVWHLIDGKAPAGKPLRRQEPARTTKCTSTPDFRSSTASSFRYSWPPPHPLSLFTSNSFIGSALLRYDPYDLFVRHLEKPLPLSPAVCNLRQVADRHEKPDELVFAESEARRKAAKTGT